MKNRFLLLTERHKNEILSYMPTRVKTQQLASYFQNFSDNTRLRIISCLSICDMCVNDLSNLLHINQTTVSHQLKILRSEKIVSFRRDGKILLYSLLNKGVNDIMLSGINAVG